MKLVVLSLAIQVMISFNDLTVNENILRNI